MTYTNSILGKRWKPIILWKINAGSQRFSELQREIPLVSRKMLYQELKELTHRGMLESEGHGVGRRHRLSSRGESLIPLLRAMWDWGERNRPEVAQPVLLS